LALNRATILFPLELDVRIFHLYSREHLLHLVDRLLDSVLLCLLADFRRLSADGVHLVVHSCCC